MANWSTVEIKFDLLDPILDPLQAGLKALQAIEAVLEGILDILKAFLIDFGNPLQAIFALLLAAIRAIINQIKATGFSFLLVHPDMSTGDFAATLASVSGSYTAFESKVTSKFYDTSDIFRPQYADGSSIAMIALYLGAETPNDLFLQLYALMELIKSPFPLSRLPAPVSLKVNPVRQSGDPVANFRSLFDDDLDDALAIEWQMPTNPTNVNTPSFSNSLTGIYNAFRFPKFVVERSESPKGEPIRVEVNSQTMGDNVKDFADKYGMPVPETTAAVLESDNSDFRIYGKRFEVSGSNLLQGRIAGTYRYIDNDPSLVRGKTYYYRVRAYFGDASAYVNSFISSDLERFVIFDQEQPRFRFGTSVTMGLPSGTTRGFVPRKIEGFYGMNPYDVILLAVKAGILLNFDLPTSPQGSSPFEIEQRTGWGVLSPVAGQISSIKSFVSDSDSLKANVIFQTMCRKVANQSLTNIFSQPALMALLAGKWSKIKLWVESLVERGEVVWKFPPVLSGFTEETNTVISNYLSLEEDYKPGISSLEGPYPIGPYIYQGNDISVSADQRQELANFLRASLTGLSGSTSYLSWYSVTIGDLFPAFNATMFDFEQFILALLKSLQTALQTITDIVETLIQKVKALEQFLKSLINLIELFNIEAKASVLAFSSSNGSADDLVGALRSSENKPVDSPFGLHSGLILTFGGPGEGSVAAFQAFKFILGLP